MAWLWNRFDWSTLDSRLPQILSQVEELQAPLESVACPERQKQQARDRLKVARQEVERLTRVFGENGGFILCPSNNFMNDTPLENILAFYGKG